MQKGSLVAPDRLRFDFSHMKPITDEEMKKIDENVNKFVNSKTEVVTRLMTPEEGIEQGAMALFGEKYGDEVRVVFMGEEGNKYFSTELCGGTHVKNTSEVGKFKVVSQSSIAAGVRRVEALRDKQLEEYLKSKDKMSSLSSQKNEETIKSLSSEITKLGGKPIKKSEDLKTTIKELTKQFEEITVKSILSDKKKNIVKDQNIEKINIRFQKVDDLPFKELRRLVDQGKKDIKEGIVVIYAIKDDKIGLAVGVTDSLTKKYDAIKFVKSGSEILGGKGGGGRSDFAQAGGVHSNKIEESFEKIKSLI